MKLFDYVDQNELTELVTAGFVGVRKHPEAPLSILNYTHHAQASGDWSNDTLRKCRGLIYNYATLEIVAIPWTKFFNYGDPNTGELPDERVVVTDKADGSLSIFYHTSDAQKWVATRGSFTSPQAEHATEWLHNTYPDWDWDPDYTPLGEVIYPENRIVLAYDFDAVVLLGAVHVPTCRYIPAQEAQAILQWPGRITETFESTTLAEALALPPRENAEGVVVQFVDSGKMVKVKQEDYLRLHRILYSLSNKFIWDQLVKSGTCEFDLEPEIKDVLPQEIIDWAYETLDNYVFAAWEVYKAATLHLARYQDLQMGPDYFKTVAISAQSLEPPVKNAVLMLMRNDYSEGEAMSKILYWLGYGTFQRPQNVTNEEE